MIFSCLEGSSQSTCEPDSICLDKISAQNIIIDLKVYRACKQLVTMRESEIKIIGAKLENKQLEAENLLAIINIKSSAIDTMVAINNGLLYNNERLILSSKKVKKQRNISFGVTLICLVLAIF